MSKFSKPHCISDYISNTHLKHCIIYQCLLNIHILTSLLTPVLKKTTKTPQPDIVGCKAVHYE